ncbi:MAG: hypothetical protein GXC78_05475 [Chitinophagaceae bacterium]|nr:hypothetical protein [Chitinophagaceae bacterium]
MKKKIVIAKGNDGFNNWLDNIEVVNNNERMKRLFLQRRVPLVLAEMDCMKFKLTFNLWRLIYKCGLKGTGVAKGRYKTHKRFKWKYASRKVLQPLI